MSDEQFEDFDDFDNEAYTEKLEYYMEIGAIELEGVDENGEIIYSITELAQELAPELWESHEEYISKSMIDLYERGLVEIEYDENLEATFKISPEGMKAAREYGLIDQFDEDVPDN